MSDRLIRDRFTWLAHGKIAYFAFLLSAPGAAMPMLRNDLNLSYTVGGMHFSAMALGRVVAGMLTASAVRRWGRPAIFWAGGAGMALGALLMAVGHHPVVTIGGTLIMGLLGTTLLATVFSGLSDRHPHHRPAILTESQMVASIGTVLPPLVVGSLEQLSVGWRVAFIVPPLLWLTGFLTLRGVAVPPSSSGDQQRDGRRLPPVFWVLLVAMAASLATEWTIVAWGASYLVDVGDVEKATASMAMAFFFMAMASGRLVGSRLSRHLAPQRLFYGAAGLATGGFLVFWLAPVAPLMVVGLFLTGLGLANMLPLLLSLAVATSPDRATLASSRLVSGGGVALLIAPQTLGLVADQVGIRSAFVVVLGLIALAVTVATIARRMEDRHV